MGKNFKQLLNQVKAFVFDVDGVFTDGSLIVMPGNELIRVMNTRDGYAVKEATRKGYKVCAITGGKSESTKKRLLALGMNEVYLGAEDKVEKLDEFLLMYDLKYEDILYMGDDMPDYEVIQKVGVPTCPHDAVPEIKQFCAYISDKNGGQGCVRDVIEQTMKVQGKWVI